MEIKKNHPINGIALLLILAVSILYVARAESGMPIFTVALSNRALTFYSPAVQQAQANSDFLFHLEPLVSVTKPEIDYKVTNNSKNSLGDIGLIELPSGLTRVYEGENVCAETFRLDSQQSCILRFYVDKSRYVHSLRGGPIVCVRSSWGCSRPSVNSQIDDAVARVPNPTEIVVSPKVQDGLHYDPATASIKGKPTRTGVYHFKINATNGKETTSQRDLEIDANVNPHDKPVFKKNYSLDSMMPEQTYRLNLMKLIEVTPGFAETNQVRFSIVSNQEHPDWLHIDKETSIFLQGLPPSYEAGKVKQITLIATSNTGGESLPMTIQIPVAFDPEKKPVIENGLKLTGAAGEAFHSDFRINITDPTSDGSLKLILDKIEPSAPWLSVSPSNPTELTGVVPLNAVGQMYQLIVHANTEIGGDSEPLTIPLQILIDENKTPRFYSDKPQLPLCYAGQPYFYDFAGSNDVIPGYNSIPYTVEFADGYRHPAWLRIENNKLIADKVPKDLETIQTFYITIKNIPGGESKAFRISLAIMN